MLALLILLILLLALIPWLALWALLTLLAILSLLTLVAVVGLIVGGLILLCVGLSAFVLVDLLSQSLCAIGDVALITGQAIGVVAALGSPCTPRCCRRMRSSSWR